MKLPSLLVPILSIAVLLTTGCANRDMQAKHSGFLKNYEHLKENDKLEGTRAQIMPGADFTKYENIYIEPTKIISQIPENEWTPEQKILFEKISEYLTNGYKETMKNSTGYRLVEDKNTPKTIIFESAISAVEVHFDDMEWYQFTPVSLGLTAIARATYVDAAVRILGEGRLIDASNNKLLMRAMTLQKADEVSTEADKLVFNDVKPALDTWIKRANENVIKMRKGIIKYQKEE